MSDLNNKRLALSNELMDIINQQNTVNNQWLDSLTMKQYNVYYSFHLKVGCLSTDQLNKITKSKKIKTLALKAYILQDRALKVNAELDAVLDSMEKQWQLVRA